MFELKNVIEILLAKSNQFFLMSIFLFGRKERLVRKVDEKKTEKKQKIFILYRNVLKIDLLHIHNKKGFSIKMNIMIMHLVNFIRSSLEFNIKLKAIVH